MSVEKPSSWIRRALLPGAVFLAVFGFHYLWNGFFPEGEASRSRWALPEDLPNPGWFARYVETQSFYLGFSYALSLAFAAWALRRYGEERLCDSRVLALGGITLSGFFAVAGCYLLGCCGSPMLVVYASLLGTSFLPFAKPLVALMTLISIASAAFYLIRRSRKHECCEPSRTNGS